jgi:uncharacterized protein with PIN domain
MLGGLARWLRAAGYDARWEEGIDDWELVRLAQRGGRVLLTSDTGIGRIGIVRDGEVPSLFIPHGLSKTEQLAYVRGRLDLPLREPRCMACGGELRGVTRESVRERVPPGTIAEQQEFLECGSCGRLFWQGSHWRRIAAGLAASPTLGTGSPDTPDVAAPAADAQPSSQ